MLVSKFYSFGILSVVAHKLIMEILDEEQKKVDIGGNLMRIPFFGLFNLQVNVNAANPVQNQEDQKVEKIAEHAALILSIGNSFINPGWTIFSSTMHCLIKALKISVKSQRINPAQKQKILSYILKFKFFLIGFSALMMFMNPLSSQVDYRYLKK